MLRNNRRGTGQSRSSRIQGRTDLARQKRHLNYYIFRQLTASCDSKFGSGQIRNAGTLDVEGGARVDARFITFN